MQLNLRVELENAIGSLTSVGEDEWQDGPTPARYLGTAVGVSGLLWASTGVVLKELA